MPALSPGATIEPDKVYVLTGETLARLQAFLDAFAAAEIRYAGQDQGPRVIITQDFTQVTFLLPRPGSAFGGVDPSTLSLIPVRLCLDNGATVQAQLLGRIV
jgi:hypothetical protein